MVKEGSYSFLRETYLRFDLSSLASNIASAQIQIRCVGGLSANYQAELVTDNSWGEMTITAANNPPGSTVLATWVPGDDINIEVTDVLTNAMAQDGTLSIRIISTLGNGNYMTYGSRENTNSNAWPQLVVNYDLDPMSYAGWVQTQGLEERVNDGYSDDPEMDGMDNLLEFALGANSLTNDASLFLPRCSISAADGTHYLNYVYRRRINPAEWGLVYVVGSTPDLMESPATNATVEAGSGAINARFESVTNQVSVDIEDSQFMQLKVTID